LDAQEIWSGFKDAKSLVGHYDKRADTLYICREDYKDAPGASVDVEGEFWLRIDPKTNQVIGFEIEDFVSIFLQKNPELERVWRQSNARHFIRRSNPETKQSTLLLILERLRALFSSSPKMRFA
jgi:uncharacterized protein YuzE